MINSNLFLHKLKMIQCQNDKLWTEHLPNLVCSRALIPMTHMNLAEQLNALTRLVIVIFLVLLLFGIGHSIIFLLLAMLFIICLYYIQKNRMSRETYSGSRYKKDFIEHYDIPSKDRRMMQRRRDKLTENYSRITLKELLEQPNACRFCDDSVELDGPNGAYNNPNYISANQQLAGPANPKTKIAPIIAPPAADFEYWRVNNSVLHSAVNDVSNTDAYQSGYQVSTCCAGTYNDWNAIPTQPPLQQLAIPVCNIPEYNTHNTNSIQNQNQHQGHSKKVNANITGTIKEGFEMPRFRDTVDDTGNGGLFIRPNGSGQVNTACGYNPEQLFRAGLPTNLAAGNCMQQPQMKTYNENLFTQTIQPGVYSVNNVNEPINANMGISFTQQFEPRTCQTNPISGDMKYTEHDPRIIEPIIPTLNTDLINAVSEGNIYDPRFTGYGTSYRSYTEDVTGQTRYYYDDINAVRMPNYVVRSNIDREPFADQYGPIKGGDQDGNKWNSNIHALANNAFLDSTIQFRTELQERLMRKTNAEQWQRRAAPINTNGQRMIGGFGANNR